MFKNFKARIIARVDPEPGEEFNIFTNKDLEVGDDVAITPPGKVISGKVIEKHANNPKYQNHTLTGGKVVNTGKGYYKIKAGKEE